jgi:hypothetical protein
MPKSSSDDVDGAADGIPQGGRNKNKKKGQDQTQAAATKRELGRLKNKRALAEAVHGSMGREQSGGENERENKRLRSENQDDKAEDVAMSEP